MFEARCYHCDCDNELEESATWSVCRGCAQQLHLPSLRQLAAIERLAQAARTEVGLDEDRRGELLDVLQRQRAEVRAQAVGRDRPPAPESPKPPPLPAVEPPRAASTPPPIPTATAHPPAAAVVAEVSGRASAAAREPRPHPIPPRGPSLWSRLGPLFGENLLFALAGFLLVAGAVYFTTTAWTTMSGSSQKLVVAGGLLLFAALTHGAGVVLGKAEGLRSAARVLSLVAIALTPAATTVAGLLYAADPGLALPVAAIAAAAGHLFLRTLVRREGQTLPASVPWLLDALVFAGVFASALADSRLLASCAAAAVPVLVAWLQRRLHRPTATVPAIATFVLLANAIGALAFAIGLAIAHGPPFTLAIAPLGVVIAAAALAAVVLESTRGVPAPAALTAALAVGIAAVLVATGDLRCLMVAAWAAAATCVQASLRLDRARVLAPALVLSAIAYLFLPAPIRELAMRLRAETASQLGYEPQRLPLSFYGITFVPYLLGLALLGMWFRQTARDRHRRVCGAWAMSVAIGLAAMSLLLGSDLRAPMAVLPTDGLLLVLLGYLSRSAGAVLAGCLLVLGGLCCLLAWLEVPFAVGTAAGTAAAMVLVLLANRPADAGSFAARAQHSYGRAATIAVVASALWSLVRAWPAEAWRNWNLLHVTLLVPVLVMLRRSNLPLQEVARRTPSVLLVLVLPVIWASATGAASVVAEIGAIGTMSPRLAMPAALAAMTGVGYALLLLLPACDARPAQRRGLVLGMFALHALLLPDLIDGYDPQSFAWITVCGTATLAAAAGALAVRVGLYALLALALVEATFPAHLLAIAWLGDASGPPGLVGPVVLATTAAVLGARRPPVAAVASVLGALTAVAAFGMRLTTIPVLPPRADALSSLAIAVMLLAVPAWRARQGTERTHASERTWIAAGAIAAMLGALSVLDLLASGLQQYAAGMLVIAGLSFAAAALWREVSFWLSSYGLLQLAIAIALLFVWQPTDGDGHLLRFGSFAAAGLIGLACRPRPLRTVATLLMAAAGAGALVLQPVELYWVAERWWTAVAIGWCAVGLAVTAMPKWSARAYAARLVAVPAVSLMAIVLVSAVAIFNLAQQSRGTDMVELVDGNAGAFVVAAFALALHVPQRFRGRLAWLAVGLAAFATTPINGLLHGGREAGLRPDAEAALLALGVAVLGRLRIEAGSWALTLAALLLTTMQLDDVSTPVTMTLLAGVPLALLLRCLAGPNGTMHGVLLVLATWSWITFAMSGQEAAALAPWLALSAALLAMLVGPWLRLIGTHEQVAGQILAVRAVTWVAALAALLTLCASPPSNLPRLDLFAALAAGALVLIGSVRAARVPQHAPLVHVGLAAGITCYLILVAGTELLAVMTNRHHHALGVLGATLFLVAGHRRSAMGRQLRAAAVVATLLAVLLAIALGGLTFALFAGALVTALGAALGRARWLATLALMLANAGLFRLWLHEGIFDPSFYGVPAGLSLVFGAEMARRPLGDARVLALRVTGLAVLYGSVLVQIARVAVPLHALALFVLAMAAVAYGAMRRQAAIMVIGVAAVVLDVITYLAQRGFEQDFLGSVLLIGAGAALFVVAARAARRRAGRSRPE